MLRAGRYGFRFPAGAGNLCSNRPSRLRGHPASSSVSTVVLWGGGYSGRAVLLTTNLHLTSNLRVTGVITLLRLEACRPHLYSNCHIPYTSGIQPGVRVPPGIREGMLAVRKIKK